MPDLDYSTLFAVNLPLHEPHTRLMVCTLPASPDLVRLWILDIHEQDGRYVDVPRFILAGLLQLFADLLAAPQARPLILRPSGLGLDVG